ncbi:uncharacterized protein LOC126617311 [Malus sylvestris]|uniref:uncharacterized protein LOC126617311 n=1 Tax=Malus sylvestris TaxID=3752 RepID=UPI0021AC17CA|nr:uncharacterized protein LOC126617311 [Malus sylvestris]
MCLLPSPFSPLLISFSFSSLLIYFQFNIHTHIQKSFLQYPLGNASPMKRFLIPQMLLAQKIYLGKEGMQKFIEDGGAIQIQEDPGAPGGCGTGREEVQLPRRPSGLQVQDGESHDLEARRVAGLDDE